MAPMVKPTRNAATTTPSGLGSCGTTVGKGVVHPFAAPSIVVTRPLLVSVRSSVRAGRVAAGGGTPRSSARRQERAHPHEVIDREPEGEHPADAPLPAVLGLAHEADRLGPAEDPFGEAALALAHRIPGMASGPAVDRAAPAALVLADVRRDLLRAERGDERAGVVALVHPERRARSSPGVPDEGHRGVALGGPAGHTDHPADGEAVAVVAEHVALIAEPGLLARALAIEPGLRVGRRAVGVVAPALALEVARGP